MTLAKKAAGYAAVEHVTNGMTIGLGTGSTVHYFIERLAQLCVEGLRIKAVSTSEASQKHAQSLAIPLVDINSITSVDLTVDGADEIDSNHRMIKGGGGALLREKLVALMSENVIIIIDENKLVTDLGKFPLPVEIVSFAYQTTQKRLENKGYQGILRKQKDGSPFVTDQGNFIIDIKLGAPCNNPEEHHQKIKQVSGVVETGFFFGLAKNVIVGYADGHTNMMTAHYSNKGIK